ncbi:MAG: hypothetical protein KBC64_02080 [Simkaniaceae bacterium]|nr:hypothetical protein [Simkaniaceae bacterium]
MNALKKWHNFSLSVLTFIFILSGGILFFGKSPSSPLPLPMTSTEERRFNVRKDLYLYQNGKQLHSRISCSKSRLNSSLFVEEMEDVEGVFQTKCDKETQELRTFSSEKGVYNYKTHTFRANSVLLHFYKEPGNKLPSHFDPEKAFLQGIAEEVTLVMEKKPDFKAEKFQADIKIE